MEMTRRNAIALGAGALLFAGLPLRVSAAAEDLIAEFTGGADVGEGDISLTAPEIAENGNTVPISVSAPGATAHHGRRGCGAAWAIAAVAANIAVWKPDRGLRERQRGTDKIARLAV